MLIAAATLGCGGRQTAPTITDPAERPPLPPSSGTPIGLLLDEPTRLRLTSAQVDSLRAIDESLSARNDALDAQTRSPAGAAPASGPPGGFSGRRHGHRGRRGGGGGPPAMHGGGDPAAAGRANDGRAANIHDAIDRAMAVLDVGQKAIACQLLDEHGVKTAPPAPIGAANVPDDDESTDPDEPTGPSDAGEM